jgi:hypothetical protein
MLTYPNILTFITKPIHTGGIFVTDSILATLSSTRAKQLNTVPLLYVVGV